MLEVVVAMMKLMKSIPVSKVNKLFAGAVTFISSIKIKNLVRLESVISPLCLFPRGQTFLTHRHYYIERCGQTFLH